MRFKSFFTLYKIFFIFLSIIIFRSESWATHNRAGEITIEQIGPLTIRMTINTYTKASSVDADRDSLLVDWGDGNTQFVRRVNGNGEIIEVDTKFNRYVAEHTYPGRNIYKISMADPNRNGGILNVNFPNSILIPFYLEIEYTFLNQQFQGPNNTPILLQPPIDLGCVGQLFTHNPNAFDKDGDSLAYELIIPQQGPGQVVPNYLYPNQISPGGNNNITFNQLTGDFRWENPQQAGEYNIAMRINEYRNGIKISSTIRDLQIDIQTCNNRPPIVEAEENYCVIAGQQLNIPLMVDDPDIGQQVQITPFGGPFVQDFSPAEIIGPSGYNDVPFDALIQWNTLCDHIAPQPYTAIIRAVDNFFSANNGLTTLKTINIQVNAPPPIELEAIAKTNNITVSWESPYNCETTNTNYFRGFDVWRRVNSNPFEPVECETGLAGRGYTQVAFSVSDMENGRYSFIDENVEKGRTYCYRITGVFARLSSAGFPFNLVQSIPSEEVCQQLVRDVPFPLNVDVKSTNESQGEIFIRWTRPNPADLDTMANPGPYSYQLERSPGLNTSAFQPIPEAFFTSDNFSEPVDSSYLDTGLNTSDNAYTYRIAFYTNGNTTTPYDYSPTATSVRLNVVATDRRINLTWDEAVPWENYKYAIFKYNEVSGIFDSIAVTENKTYTDWDVVNDREYCFAVKGFGQYGINDLPFPLLNFSQEICAIPIDTVPPCPPLIHIENPCTQNTDNSAEFTNIITWRIGSGDCYNDDLVKYRVYFSTAPSGPFTLLAELNRNENRFEHIPPPGSHACYSVTAVDSVGNESSTTNFMCAEECPDYILPNTFTPNGDGNNDLFKPRVNRSIERVEFQVYNRWGNLVFQTNDPALNWDGRNLKGEFLDAATYFYKCTYFRIGSSGNGTTISGYIELIK